jgi:serine/threonine protein kinase
MPLDRRSDVFSLGILLWEMVTTQRLFKGDNDLQTLQLIIHQAPKKPTEFQPACSPELERIILKALSQDITTRYQSAEELLTDLEALQTAEGLGHSSAALGAYMAGLFNPEVASWQESRDKGMELAEHLTHMGDMTTPVSESEFIEAIDLDEAEEIFDEESSAEDEDAATIVPGPKPAATPVSHTAATVPLQPVSAQAVASAQRTDRTPPPAPPTRATSAGLAAPIVRDQTPPPRPIAMPNPTPPSMGAQRAPQTGPVMIPAGTPPRCRASRRASRRSRSSTRTRRCSIPAWPSAWSAVPSSPRCVCSRA